MKPKYKIILLILASDNTDLYKKFRQVYQQYLHSSKDIKVFFVYGQNISFEPEEYDIVCSTQENYYPGMIVKTLEAMDYINKTYEYDYIVRSNLSTFWVFDRLLDRVSKLPKTNCFNGKGRRCTYKGVQSPIYISGVNLLLSKDLVELILEKKELVISWDLPEDWALSKFYLDSGIKPIFTSPASMHFMEKFYSTEHSSILYEIAEANKLNKDHFRVKNLANRSDIDITVMQLLLNEYYNKTLV